MPTNGNQFNDQLRGQPFRKGYRPSSPQLLYPALSARGAVAPTPSGTWRMIRMTSALVQTVSESLSLQAQRSHCRLLKHRSRQGASAPKQGGRAFRACQPRFFLCVFGTTYEAPEAGTCNGQTSVLHDLTQLSCSTEGVKKHELAARSMYLFFRKYDFR